MNFRLLSIATLISGLVAFAGATQAADAVAEKAPAASGTPADRKAERTTKRAELKAANKAGEIPKTGEAMADKAPAASGTAADRKAERTAKRAEVKAANKAGQIPKTTEAGEAKK